MADPTDNEINGFAVFTTLTRNDILEPKFSRSMANVIQTLQAGYSPTDWATAYTNFLNHIVNYHNPHGVTSAQILSDPTALLNQLYSQYVAGQTEPVDQPTFENMLFATVTVANANGLTDPSQINDVISAVLMNTLYTQHNTDLAAHPALQSLFTTDPIIEPVFCLEPTSGALNALAFIEQVQNGLRTFGVEDTGYVIGDIMPQNSGTILCVFNLDSGTLPKTLAMMVGIDGNGNETEELTWSTETGSPQLTALWNGQPLFSLPGRVDGDVWYMAITYVGTQLTIYQFQPLIHTNTTNVTPDFMGQLVNWRSDASLGISTTDDVVQFFAIYDQVLSLDLIQSFLGITD